MKRLLRIVAGVLLVSLALALVWGIFSLWGWGGRIETILIVFGDLVWVSLDGGRPRILLLLLVPGVFLGAALSLLARRRGE